MNPGTTDRPLSRVRRVADNIELAKKMAEMEFNKEKEAKTTLSES